MNKYWSSCLPVIMSLLLTACSTGFHGSYVANTYMAGEMTVTRTAKGLASGSSCQTRVLYLFPSGDPPSTQEALALALKQYAGTAYLANVTVENRTEWAVGYLRQCTTVTGAAY